MTNRANIFYDHEIEELVRSRSVELLPMILHMFAQYPHGTVEDIFYTIELHVREHGTQTYPGTLLSAPAVEYAPAEEPAEELNVEEDLGPIPEETDATEDTLDEQDEKEPSTPERRNIQRRVVTENPHEKLNVRNIMNDLKGIDL
jgi:hypothetical protein